MTWGMTWGMSLDGSEVRLNSPGIIHPRRFVLGFLNHQQDHWDQKTTWKYPRGWLDMKNDDLSRPQGCPKQRTTIDKKICIPTRPCYAMFKGKKAGSSEHFFLWKRDLIFFSGFFQIHRLRLPTDNSWSPGYPWLVLKKGSTMTPRWFSWHPAFLQTSIGKLFFWGGRFCETHRKKRPIYCRWFTHLLGGHFGRTNFSNGRVKAGRSVTSSPW